MTDLAPPALRDTFGAWPTGIALVAAEVDGEAVGILANSFTSVSLDPPLVSVSVAHTSSTWPVLSRARRVGISVLGGGDTERAGQLRRPGAERFHGIELRKAGDSALLLPDAAATLIVDRYFDVEAGDHVIALFRVVDHSRDNDAAPLVFHGGRLRQLAG